MKNRHITLAILALALSAAAQQPLKTEIDVDRTIVPQYRDVDRPSAISPALLDAPQQTAQLSAAEYLLGGTATTTMAQLPAAPWADSIPRTPYRGYASIGYFPVYNLGVNAGYRVVDTRRATLGLWLQYSGLSYKGRPIETMATAPAGEKTKMHQHWVALGLDGRLATGSQSALTYDIDYTHAIIGMPLQLNGPYDRGTNDLGVNLRWDDIDGIVKYGFRGGFDYFGYTSQDAEQMLPGGSLGPQRQIGGKAGVSLGAVSDDSTQPWIGADIDLDIFNVATKGVDKSHTLAEGYIKPYYRYANGPFSARVGLNVSLAFGNRQRGAVHVAPDIDLSLATKGFAAYLNARGGEHLNGLDRMFVLNPYAYTLHEDFFARTNVPVDLKLGFNVGPFAGFSIGAYGQYAMVRDWYMPSLVYGMSVWSLCDKFNSSRVGVRAAYDYADLLSASVEYTTALHGWDKGRPTKTWYEWIDGTRDQLAASLTVRPIAPLSLTAAYNLRTHRQAPSTILTIYSVIGDDEDLVDLRDISDLSFRADYRLTPAFTIFAIGQNLLGTRAYLPSALPAPGVTGSIGIAAKF